MSNWPEWTSPDGRIRLINADCLDVRASLPHVDAVLADPPYGIDYDASESTQFGIKKFEQFAGEKETFDPTPWIEFKDAILWGCNNYCHAIPPKIGQWYFWDKVTRNSLDVRIAEGEFCWHKRGTKPRAFRHLWSGAYRASEAGQQRLHPTQKPIALMEWCIRLLEGETILDPYAGSGTVAVACIRTDRRCIGIEIDTTHYATAVARCKREYARTALFNDQEELATA